MSYKILSINPGSTSTKVACYEDENMLFTENIEHSTEELAKYDGLIAQTSFRADNIRETLKKHNIALSDISGVAGRGGMLPGIVGGAYQVNDDMVSDLGNLAAPHASNLGGILAYDIAKPLGINAYIYDAVTSMEFNEIATITGIPEIKRSNACHVLNMKAKSRQVAKGQGRKYEDMRFIVVHLGGGVSVSLHEGGKIIDSISDDFGPFAPERGGSAPLLQVIELCYSEKYTKKEMLKKVRGDAGLKAYFGTADCREVEKMIEGGDTKAKLVYEAMAYNIAKGVCSLAPVVNGKVDYIILTGGLANSKMLTGLIADRVKFLAPVEVLPGEGEMESLSLGVLRILKGEETAREYKLFRKAD